MKYSKKIFIILVSIIITVCIIGYIVYQMNHRPKTVYLVWRSLKDKSKSNGFGDKLRSVIATRQFCKENGYRFVLDATDDICGAFLKHVKSNEYPIIKDKPLLHIDCHPHDSPPCNFSQKMYSALNKKDSVFLYTNKCPNNDDCVSYNKDILNDIDDKEFAKYICEPIDSLKEEVEEKKQHLPHNYGIQHFRFSDDVFKKDITENDTIFIKYFQILESSYKDTDVLLSNSTNFKRYAKTMLNIKTVECNGGECKVEHIGHSDNYESVKSSFIEFYIISNAKYVKTLSSYGWVSNFIKWPALLYDIPLEVHKLD